MKQLLLVNDLSCVGKVAISATLPILSIAQLETSLLPTVLLSTHTGFAHPYRQSLNQDMLFILEHFKQLNLSFDGLLTGYMSDTSQIKTLLNHLPQTKQLIVDPVMADNGILYTGFTDDYPLMMQKLCQKADIIMPNLTEACLLTNQSVLKNYNESSILTLLKDLQQLGPKIVMITGISFNNEQIGVAYLKEASFGYVSTKYIHKNFSGTGDIFSALVTALLLHHIPIEKAIRVTLDFIVASLEDTLTLNRDSKYGIFFEKQLLSLATTIRSLLIERTIDYDKN